VASAWQALHSKPVCCTYSEVEWERVGRKKGNSNRMQRGYLKKGFINKVSGKEFKGSSVAPL
jgi:hypothetical protein